MISCLKKRKFTKLIKEYLDSMYQLAYMRCGNKELAEDLVQEASIKAYKSYLDKNEREITNPKGWLYRILINTHIDFTRKKQQNLLDISEFDISYYENKSKDIDSSIFFKDLKEALKTLDPEQRVVIYLCDVNEYSYKEIAEVLDIPLGTVMSRLHRARQSLRKILSKKEFTKEYIQSGEKQ